MQWRGNFPTCVQKLKLLATSASETNTSTNNRRTFLSDFVSPTHDSFIRYSARSNPHRLITGLSLGIHKYVNSDVYAWSLERQHRPFIALETDWNGALVGSLGSLARRHCYRFSFTIGWPEISLRVATTRMSLADESLCSSSSLRKCQTCSLVH